MITTSSHAEGDLVTKTEVLRASADELALRVEDQNKEITRLRNVLEQLKADHSTHITSTINRMNEIDGEMIEINNEKQKYDRRSAEALKKIEAVRSDLVLLGAKLAKEFIMLPPAVTKYPRIDHAASKGSVDDAAIMMQHRGSHWYTDEQPASNLEMVDMVIASAIAALDGRIEDEEFRSELEQARNNPDSVFSKESLIQSVAASSPMKRRRASLLMLSQASQQLSKQSATFDDLTRGPCRWTEGERMVAVKTSHTQDAMIRDAVKEICKVAPVPRQAERQLLTSLNMHSMPIDPLAASTISSMKSKSVNFFEDSSNSLQKDENTNINNDEVDDNVTSPKSKMTKKQKQQQQQILLQQQQSAKSSSFFNRGHLNIPIDDIAESAVDYATASKGSGKDSMLRRLQSELEDEQSAMSLRSHAARMKAWQELDLKRTARERLDQEEAIFLREREMKRNGIFPSPSVQNNNNNVSSPSTNIVADTSSFSSPLSSSFNPNRHPTTSFGSSTTEKNKNQFTTATTTTTPKPAAVFAMVMSDANILPVMSTSKKTPSLQFSPNKPTKIFSSNNEDDDDKNIRCVTPPRMSTINQSTSSESNNNIENRSTSTTTSPTTAKKKLYTETRITEQYEKSTEFTPVHRSTGLILRDSSTVIVDPVLVAQRRRSSPNLQAKEKEEAKSGVCDPETATKAITMRRTGELESASLSYHSSRLDQAAKRLGVERPTSGTRFHWKLKQSSTRRSSSSCAASIEEKFESEDRNGLD